MESSTASRDTAKAMLEENVETARRVLETVSRDGPEAVLRGMPPEFVWDASPTGIPGLGLYRGPNEIRSFFEDWFKVFPFEEWEVALDEFIGHGDQVVVKARQRGRGAGSGAAVEVQFAQVWAFRNGEPVRVTNYMTYDEALEAAGLSE
jgi:ketosteroid isomerase-like protein